MYDGNIIQKFYIQFFRYKLLLCYCKALSNLRFTSHMLSIKKFVKLIASSEIYCSINTSTSFRLPFAHVLNQSVLDATTKKKYIYERKFISQRNCDVLRIISDASRHPSGIRDETFRLCEHSVSRAEEVSIDHGVGKLQRLGGLRALTSMAQT